MFTFNGAIRRLRLIGFATVLAGSTSIAAVTAASPAVAHTGSPHWCQCVEYIKHLYGITARTGDAKQMGGYLRTHGFEKRHTPEVGAVVVFQPSFGVNSAGHVGVIQKVWNRGDQWQLNVRGARQGGSVRTRADCTNVSDVVFRSYAKTSNAVAYYMKK